MRSALKVALVAGGLGALVALLISFEAPSWTIYSWVLGTESVEKFPGSLAGTTHLAVSPDGRLLASVSRDDIVRIWNVHDCTLVASLYHLPEGWAAVRGDGKYRYGGDVTCLGSGNGARAYRFEDLDVLIPDQRL